MTSKYYRNDSAAAANTIAQGQPLCLHFPTARKQALPLQRTVFSHYLILLTNLDIHGVVNCCLTSEIWAHFMISMPKLTPAATPVIFSRGGRICHLKVAARGTGTDAAWVSVCRIILMWIRILSKTEPLSHDSACRRTAGSFW